MCHQLGCIHLTAGRLPVIGKAPRACTVHQDLATCADTLIGNATVGVKGISGGQKRRVSVGIQLVKVSEQLQPPRDCNAVPLRGAPPSLLSGVASRYPRWPHARTAYTVTHTWHSTDQRCWQHEAPEPVPARTHFPTWPQDPRVLFRDEPAPPRPPLSQQAAPTPINLTHVTAGPSSAVPGRAHQRPGQRGGH